jgi:predicted thioesterase
MRSGRRTMAASRADSCVPEATMTTQPLAVGLKHTRTVKVTDDMTPSHLRNEPIRVLSTPDMIRLIEQTAILATQPFLAAGQATVGTRVDVAHLAATPVGMTVRAEATLLETDGKRFLFSVEAWDEKEKIGEGHHERFVVADLAKFLARVAKKKEP